MSLIGIVGLIIVLVIMFRNCGYTLLATGLSFSTHCISSFLSWPIFNSYYFTTIYLDNILEVF